MNSKLFTAENVMSYNDNIINCSYNGSFQMISQNVFGVVPISNIYNISLSKNFFTKVFVKQQVTNIINNLKK